LGVGFGFGDDGGRNVGGDGAGRCLLERVGASRLGRGADPRGGADECAGDDGGGG